MVQKLLHFFLLTILITAATLSCTAQPVKKIIFIPGTNSHDVGEHEYLGASVLFSKLLNKHLPGADAIVTEQGWPKDTTVLDKADAIVLFCDGGEQHAVLPHLAHIDRLMKKGVGLVLIHYAVEVPKEKAATYLLNWVGGYFETNYSVNPFWTPTFEPIPKHATTSGVKPFEVADEWYYHLWLRKNDANVIPVLSALPPASTLNRPDGPHSNNPSVREDVLEKKIPQVVAWAYTRPDGGRGFGFTGAHVHNNWMNDNFRKLVLNAIAWTAKLPVPANGIDTPTPSQQEMDALTKKSLK